MKSAKRRIEQLEREAAPDRPYLSVKQDLNDRDVYRDLHGKAYTLAELEELEATHNIIMIVYTDDWREDPDTIKLSWGDDD